MQAERIISDLAELVGEQSVITKADTLKRYSADYIGYSRYQRADGLYPVPPAHCIVEVKSTQEVSAVLKYLNANRISAIPRTGGSSVTGAIESVENSVIVDGSRMNGVIEFNEQDMYMTVKCGTPLEYMEKYCNEKGYTTGHFPQSLPMAHIGGLIATRSIGQFSTLYGGIEDLVVGLEAVLANGEVIRIKNNPRRAAGSDIRQIFVGSEGSLAFTTEATVKIFRHYPDTRYKMAFEVDTMDIGLSILREIMAAGYKPAVARLHDRYEVAHGYNAFVSEGKALLFFIAEGPNGIVEATGEAIDGIAREHGAVPIGAKLVEHWLVHRNDECEIMDNDPYYPHGVIADTCEISGHWSCIGRIYDNVIKRATEEIESLVFIGAHSSHSYTTGTNIYFKFAFKLMGGAANAREEYMALVGDIILEETLKLGGSIAHHHGTGRYRTEYMPREHGSAYVVFEILKDGLDPNNIMNTGVLVDKGRK